MSEDTEYGVVMSILLTVVTLSLLIFSYFIFVFFFGGALTHRGVLIAAIITPLIVFRLRKANLNFNFKSSKIEEKKIDSTTVILLYILSFFIPFAGVIVGAIYLSKDEEHYKHIGKNCLIFSVMNIVFGLLIIAALSA